jgi:hypothetical protein
MPTDSPTSIVDEFREANCAHCAEQIYRDPYDLPEPDWRHEVNDEKECPGYMGRTAAPEPTEARSGGAQ